MVIAATILNSAMTVCKFDGKVAFNKLTDVYHAAVGHSEDQPSHLHVLDTNICATRCAEEYGNPCQRFCPAAVYEMVDDGDERQAEAADQLFKLRSLQDLRHHGSLPDYQLGNSGRWWRAGLQGNVRAAFGLKRRQLYSSSSSFLVTVKLTRPRITSSRAMRVFLCLSVSISMRGRAPRCSCLLRFAARIIRRYFESTSGAGVSSAISSVSSVDCHH